MYNDYYVDSSYSSLQSGLEYMATSFLVVVGVVFIIFLILYIITIIGYWKILKKGGKPGWASLIPIYNTYQLCKMVGVNPWWILIVIFSGLLEVIPIIGNIFALIVSIYFVVLLNVSLARSFNKSDSYAIGLILLPVVFYPMLGIGSATYVGQNPMKDFIFKDNNQSDNVNSNQQSSNSNNQFYQDQQYIQSTSNMYSNNQSVDQTQNNVQLNNNFAKYCIYCGAELPNGSNHCSKCEKDNV